MMQPRSSMQTGVVTALVLGALLACKRKGDTDPDRPLPTVQVPVTTTPPPASPTPLGQEPARPRPAAPAPRRTAEAEPETQAEEPAAAEPSAGTDAGSVGPTTETLPAPGASSDAGLPAVATTAQCLQRCQVALSTCVSSQLDGGLPGLGNSRACADTFAACSQACAAK